MPYIRPRSMTQAEQAVLMAALARAPIGGPFHVEPETMRLLLVHSVCPCGCGSVGFLPEQEEPPSDTHLVADGMAPLAEGRWVGVLVYASRSRGPIEMEFHSPFESPAPFPEAASVQAWPAE